MIRREGIDASGPVDRIRVSDAADVTLAERKAKSVVADVGFDDQAVEEIAIVVRELASNIVKHAFEGSITFRSRSNEDQDGIEIRAEDSGPGISDVDRALTDGYSTAGSLGYGLGAVNRLMDDVVIGSSGDAETGAQIVATRWRSDSSPRITPNPLAIGAATRSKPGLEHNGDTFVIKHWNGSMLGGIVDGLGHGQSAQNAAQRAREYVQSHANQSLTSIFQGVDRACRDTRGVVMALARFDWTNKRVTVGSVGNISVKVFDAPEPLHVVVRRGVLGGNAPAPAITERDWVRSATMVMHSDGVSDRWGSDEFAGLDERSATSTARELLRSFSTDSDDATVLVVKEAET